MIHALIGLYQLKYQQQLAIKFDYDAALLTEETMEIPPMVFFSLVENAFKHSSIGLEDKAYITIVFSMHASAVEFRVENTISHRGNVLGSDYNGFGRSSLKQLMDMEFPGRYKLTEERGKDFYVTSLIIEI
jgi:LytS/YehU family sensor histidine kinase